MYLSEKCSQRNLLDQENMVTLQVNNKYVTINILVDATVVIIFGPFLCSCWTVQC